ncbi:HNH endonuclease [Peribacillus frigoritolerans]|uniref:HNH endonuclease n=1 Tax=Peribacillus frigoritolerans TaxID=450367 RepID=UPI00207A9AC5|nr:hypothetical protein [Peribacillus frigoritolerans]USK76210.1 hypothetical protein LIT31_06535 [Peribacillus frigoritolerans]
MIQLKINDEVLAKHGEFVFGTNGKKEDRIYQKVIKAYQNENNKYAKYVYRFILDRFKDIVLGDIEKLTHLKKVYSYLVNSIPSSNVREKLIADLEIFHKEYKYFYKSVGWNAYLFQKMLGITICPYCATQFIFVYNSDNGKTRGTLDHFIDKAKYPIFSISIYNLVPSCKVCNSDFKGSKEVDIRDSYTPYEENIIEYITFKRDAIHCQEEEISPSTVIDIKRRHNNEIDYVSMFLGMNEDFNIKVDYSNAPPEIARKIKGNIELFHIEEIYNAYHKNYIQDTIKKAYLYNHAYRTQLLSSFNNFFSSEEELKIAIMPAVEDDRKNILGKLTRDIVYQETKGFTL